MVTKVLWVNLHAINRKINYLVVKSCIENLETYLGFGLLKVGFVNLMVLKIILWVLLVNFVNLNATNLLKNSKFDQKIN